MAAITAATTQRTDLGVVLYEGPSVLDGAPIVAIATFKSKNVKTGRMVQTWILRQDVSPTEASKSKADGSVCGGCPHRQSLGGACYVNLGQAPLAVWKAWKAGKYAKGLDLTEAMDGRIVRLGSYGDPAAVPADVWESVTAKAKGWTGYTHQIAHKAFDKRILQWCMVSADTPKQAAAHQAHGRRTFRVKTADAPMLPGEIECLSDSKGLTCAECRLCDGAAKDATSIDINVHGSLSSRYVEKYSKANVIAVG